MTAAPRSWPWARQLLKQQGSGSYGAAAAQVTAKTVRVCPLASIRRFSAASAPAAASVVSKASDPEDELQRVKAHLHHLKRGSQNTALLKAISTNLNMLDVSDWQQYLSYFCSYDIAAGARLFELLINAQPQQTVDAATVNIVLLGFVDAMSNGPVSHALVTKVLAQIDSLSSSSSQQQPLQYTTDMRCHRVVIFGLLGRIDLVFSELQLSIADSTFTAAVAVAVIEAAEGQCDTLQAEAKPAATEATTPTAAISNTYDEQLDSAVACMIGSYEQLWRCDSVSSVAVVAVAAITRQLMMIVARQEHFIAYNYRHKQQQQQQLLKPSVSASHQHFVDIFNHIRSNNNSISINSNSQQHQRQQQALLDVTQRNIIFPKLIVAAITVCDHAAVTWLLSHNNNSNSNSDSSNNSGMQLPSHVLAYAQEFLAKPAPVSKVKAVAATAAAASAKPVAAASAATATAKAATATVVSTEAVPFAYLIFNIKWALQQQQQLISTTTRNEQQGIASAKASATTAAAVADEAVAEAANKELQKQRVKTKRSAHNAQIIEQLEAIFTPSNNSSKQQPLAAATTFHYNQLLQVCAAHGLLHETQRVVRAMRSNSRAISNNNINSNNSNSLTTDNSVQLDAQTHSHVINASIAELDFIAQLQRREAAAAVAAATTPTYRMQLLEQQYQQRLQQQQHAASILNFHVAEMKQQLLSVPPALFANVLSHTATAEEETQVMQLVTQLMLRKKAAADARQQAAIAAAAVASKAVAADGGAAALAAAASMTHLQELFADSGRASAVLQSFPLKDKLLMLLHHTPQALLYCNSHSYSRSSTGSSEPMTVTAMLAFVRQQLSATAAAAANNNSNKAKMHHNSKIISNNKNQQQLPLRRDNTDINTSISSKADSNKQQQLQQQQQLRAAAVLLQEKAADAAMQKQQKHRKR